MQGRKTYHEKFFIKFRLSKRIPKNNFYRRLKSSINLDFLYEETKAYYAQRGQKSIDPVVFFKLCLLKHIENITTDRQLIDFCGLRLDILYFLGYDVDEKLPCNTTITRTRNKFTSQIFEKLLKKVIDVCIESGLLKSKDTADDISGQAGVYPQIFIPKMAKKAVLEQNYQS
ncbi:MAG: hypothetical protein B6I20_07050 [Bacteroidetes bacterium 4572_117]|nr:MAG: hypothetical protein B6I20_07050 [Bacteroidetes bacterium 4572_117]